MIQLFRSMVQQDEFFYTKLAVVISLGALVALGPDLALADTFTEGSDAFTTVLCRVVQTLTGTAGKSIATVALFFMGVGLFFGKVSWGVAVAVALGIAAIFGANAILSTLTGDKSGTDCETRANQSIVQ